MDQIAQDVARLPSLVSNIYFVGDAHSWVLVDTGVGAPGAAAKIEKAAEVRFGPGAKPNAIILTHGHLDHAGSAKDLLSLWPVPVYAHRLELPYLTGQSSYPPIDPTTPSFLSLLGRFIPAATADLRPHVSEIDGRQPFPGIDGWEAIHTPGHTPGHLAFFRKSDGALLSGDAVITMNIDTVGGVLTKRKQLCGPPALATTDWTQARHSVQALAALHPTTIAAGHGQPMTNITEDLQHLADNLPIPSHGRYVNEPAKAGESGVTYVPPAPYDRLPKVAAGLAAATALATMGLLLTRKRR